MSEAAPSCSCGPRIDALEARVAELEEDHGGRISSLESFTRKLDRKVDQLAADVGRIADSSTVTSLTVERVEKKTDEGTLMMEKVHTLLQQLVHRETPSVVVTGV